MEKEKLDFIALRVKKWERIFLTLILEVKKRPAYIAGQAKGEAEMFPD